MGCWGRERRAYPVEELIRRLTADTAGAAGLTDRGVQPVDIAAIVSGAVTYRNGEATGAVSGRLVKGQRSPLLMAAE